MRKLAIMLVLAILLGSGAVAVMSAPSYAQAYEYPPPPVNPYSEPWVGPNTPWVYYNGDWFLNGILYYFFGPEYGWCPYYAYPPTYIVRPPRWYEPLWLAWYRGHPVYWEQFRRAYPYWRSHHEGQRYDERFYESHHRGQGGGWHQGFHGRPAAPAPPQGPRPGPAATPPASPRPGPAQVAPPAERAPSPGRMAPPERPRPGPAQMAPPEGPKPGPAPGPAHVAPPPGPRPGPAAPAPKPAPAAKPAPAPAPAAPGVPAEKGGHSEEKH